MRELITYVYKVTIKHLEFGYDFFSKTPCFKIRIYFYETDLTYNFLIEDRFVDESKEISLMLEEELTSRLYNMIEKMKGEGIEKGYISKINIKQMILEIKNMLYHYNNPKEVLCHIDEKK